MLKNSENEPKDQEDWPLKAYKNLDFLRGSKARFIRILCELLEPEDRFKKEGVDNTIVLFGSARTKHPKAAEKELKSIQALIAESPEVSQPLQKRLKEAEIDLKASKYYEAASKI